MILLNIISKVIAVPLENHSEMSRTLNKEVLLMVQKLKQEIFLLYLEDGMAWVKILKDSWALGRQCLGFMTRNLEGQNWRISDKDASWISRWQDLTDIYKTDICKISVSYIHIPKMSCTGGSFNVRWKSTFNCMSK